MGITYKMLLRRVDIRPSHSQRCPFAKRRRFSPVIRAGFTGGNAAGQSLPVADSSPLPGRATNSTGLGRC